MGFQFRDGQCPVIDIDLTQISLILGNVDDACLGADRQESE